MTIPPLRTVASLGLLLGLFLVVILGIRVVRGIERLNETASALEGLAPILPKLESGEVQHLADAATALDQAARDLVQARRETAPLRLLARPLGWLPRAGPLMRESDTLIRAAQDLVSGTRQLITAAYRLTPTSDQASPLTGGKINDAPFRSLTEQRADIESAMGRLRSGREALESLDDTALPARYAVLRLSAIGLAAELEGFAGSALVLADAWPELLGYHGPRTYLVVAQNRDELRATGGFVPGAWVVTLSEGRIVEREFWDTVTVDNFQANPPLPPEGLLESLWAGAWLFRDSTWFPHFPDTAQAMEKMFDLGPGVKVDGTIALNQAALERFLEVVGPVALPDGTELEADSFMALLEERTDEAGREYLNLVFESFLDALETPRSSEQAMALLGVMHGAFERRDILVHFHQPALSQLAATNRWDGALSGAPGDFLMVVDSNVGFSKVNRNIASEIAYEVDLSNPSKPLARLDITYRNESEGKEPPACLVQSADASGSSYEDLKNAGSSSFMGSAAGAPFPFGMRHPRSIRAPSSRGLPPSS